MPHTGDLLAELLARSGVTHVFGVPGGQTAALYDGIRTRSPRIQHLLVRDERSAGYAADAYARLTRRPGVCDVTVGPGTTKLADGLLEALNASIPLVALVGDLPRDWEPLRDKGIGSQGFDQVATLSTMTKRTWPVPNQHTLPDLVRAAFRLATSGRPGPVALVIPHDVMDAEWEPNDAELAIDERCTQAPAHRPRACRDDVTAAATLLTQAQRPVIIAGGGVPSSGAFEQLAELTERLDAAVVTSFTGKGSVPETTDHAAGVLTPLGSEAAINLAGRADLLLWCGCKVGQNTSLNWTLPTAGQTTVQLDLDAAELGRTFRPTAALNGDIAEALTDLLDQLPPQHHPDWIDEVTTATHSATEQRRERANSDEATLHPTRIMNALDERLSSNDIVVSDASFAAGWVAGDVTSRTAGRRFLFARGLGGLGYAIPAATGAATTRDSRVITVNGDGGASYALGELATHAQHGLPTINIVLNNGTLSWLRIWQYLFFDKLNQSVDLETDYHRPSLAGVASALGCDGISVTEHDELNQALDRAWASSAPVLIDVRCDPWATSVHGYRRRLETNEPSPRPGTVYQARPWER